MELLESTVKSAFKPLILGPLTLRNRIESGTNQGARRDGHSTAGPHQSLL